MFELLHTEVLLDLSHTRAAALFKKNDFPWKVLPEIREWIAAEGPCLPAGEFEQTGEQIWIAKDAVIYPGCHIYGPCIIGHRTEVRPGAFIRGSVLVGDDCVVGNSTELKNVILFDNVQAPHYNYLGDSVLGYCAHTGAGAITSNVKQDKTPITVRAYYGRIDTGMKKLGAILGDHAEIGCNAVLTPGSVIGRNTRIYPLSMVRGFIPADSIYKSESEIVRIR